MIRTTSAAVALLSVATLAACAEPAPVESVLAPFAFAANDYLASPLRDQNDRGETHEEIVARCMKEQGFEYVSGVSGKREDAGQDDAAAEDDDPADERSMFGLEDAATAGYGVVFPFSEFGEADEDAAAEPTPPPFDERLASLTPAEVDAYTVALYGNSVDDIAVDPGIPWDWTRAGCLGAADHELMVDPERSTRENPYEALMAEILDSPTAVLDSPEWTTVVASWSSCMTDAGHAGFRTLEDPPARIEAERDALLDSVRRPDTSEELVTVTDADDGVPDRDDWDGLRRRETSLATADQRCRESAHLETEYQRLYAEVERRFVDEHLDELDAMMVWISENSG